MRIGAPPFHSCRPECKLSTAIQDKEISMHAKTDPQGFNLLRSSKGKSKHERQGEEKSRPNTGSKPGAFHNDPDDPANPNEVRERHLEKIKR
jgi:hypothetical protein